MNERYRNLSVRDGDRVLPVSRPGASPEPEPVAWCGTPELIRLHSRPDTCKRGHAHHPNPRLDGDVCPRCGRNPEGDYE